MWVHAPAHSLARCGNRPNTGSQVVRALRAMRGVHPSAPRDCPSDDSGIKELPALVDALGSKRAIILYKRARIRSRPEGRIPCSPGEKAMTNAQLRGGLAAEGHGRPASSGHCQPLETDMDRQQRWPEPPFWGVATSCPAVFGRREAMP